MNTDLFENTSAHINQYAHTCIVDVYNIIPKVYNRKGYRDIG